MILSVLYIHRFITSLGFSIFVETIVLMVILKVITKHTNLPLRQILIAGIFSTFATIPYVWFVFPNMFDWPRSTALLYSEPFITIVEAVFYSLFLKTNWKTSLIVSIAANLTSFFLGPLLRAYGLWIYW